MYQFVAGSTITSRSEDECWEGAKYALHTLHISLNSEINYAKNLFSYQIYTADDDAGTNEAAITEVKDTVGEVNIPEEKYVKIVVKRHKSATLTLPSGEPVGDEPFSSSTWYPVGSDMTLEITPSEGIKLTLTTVSGDAASGNGYTTFTVFENTGTDINGTYDEVWQSSKGVGSSANPSEVYIVAGSWFKITAEVDLLAGAAVGYELDPDNYTITPMPTDKTSSQFEVGTAYTMDQEYTVHFARRAKESSCIAAGTMITLADGTQKAVENLTTDDILLVFNHETGKYDTAGITFIENDGWNYYNVINLTFSDGTHTKLIYEHALFDVTLNKYVYITESNYAEFIGHTFVSQEGDRYTEVVLTNAYVAKEYTGCYSLVTVYHLNYFIDGLLSIPGGIEGLFNIFEYGEGLKFDEEKMQADIEKYGLYTYEDFKAYIPEEIYYAFPAPYLKVAVGKGLLTFDTILQYIEQFIVKNGLM